MLAVKLLVATLFLRDCCCMVADKTEIVVRILSGPRVARQLAEELGFIYNGPVKGFPNTYLFVPLGDQYLLHDKRDNDQRISHKLFDDHRIIWADHQEVKQRQKRDFLDRDQVFEPIKRNSYRNAQPASQKRKLRVFNDELWSQEWYLQDTRTRADLPKLDLNVLPVYKDGITGKGVRVSILDDGLEHTHEDLLTNYDPDISYDCNEDDKDPLPRYEPTKSNSHGTRCAGEVSMMADNKKCGVGIAFNSKIGGIKLLDGIVNDRIEGTALSYALHLVDIYSASWGPNDDGKTVDGPGRLAREAMERGIKEGRNGSGTIYVWASGNGGSHGDNCNCDGYLASIYTISIGSASQKGEFPWYGEPCASTLAVTYSSGAYQDQMIATTDLYNECTIKHTGTSASAPLAAGIIALALEANPKLTWRDVQHLIVWTSEIAPVFDNPGWQMNTAGNWFNVRFGFGLMNAHGLVRAAMNWTRVPEKSICTVQALKLRNSTIGYKHVLTLPIRTSGCKYAEDEVKYLEHVEVRTNINYTVRGVLEVHLTSPSGTKVQLLSTRKLDKSTDGFKNWTFMSVTTWGEKANGLWILTITDNVGPESNIGYLGDTWLILHGTKKLPVYRFSGARRYNFQYNRIKSIEKSLNSEYNDNDNDDYNSIQFNNWYY